MLILCVLGSTAIAQTGDLVKNRQDRWMKCLKQSFKSGRQSTRDANAAAEMAFSACKTEEDDLWELSAASGVPRNAFTGLKSATKQVLIEGH